MHDRRDAGHEECTTGGMHNMRNAQQGGGQDRWGAGHEGCTTGGMQDMRNARQEGCRT